MNEINENKPTVRQARKSGGSVILTLTDFIKENEIYMVTKNGNNVILTNIKLENLNGKYPPEIYPDNRKK